MTWLLLTLFAPLAALGSPDWRTREQAERRLVAAGPFGWPAVWVGVRSRDQEVAARCRRIEDAYTGPTWDDAVALWLLKRPGSVWLTESEVAYANGRPESFASAVRRMTARLALNHGEETMEVQEAVNRDGFHYVKEAPAGWINVMRNRDRGLYGKWAGGDWVPPHRLPKGTP